MSDITALRTKFPKEFLWGSATSAFQIEGAGNQDGKGPSIWDEFCSQPNKISDCSNGMIACDHYNRMPEDVALMRSLGMQAYRFSISWPRILPNGTGLVETRGLDFYDRLTDTLLTNGIKPFPTLYHWDLPLALQDLGGWTNPEISHWFEEYAGIVSKRLGDRVKEWTTFNEPHVFTFIGHQLGFHAPGHTSRREYLLAMKHVQLAHGLADVRIRHEVENALVGLANSHLCLEPRTPGDENAADILDQLTNRTWLDPFIHGSLPPAVERAFEEQGIRVNAAELTTMHRPLDFAGVNYYMRMLASHTGNPHRPYNLEHPSYEGAKITDIGWEEYPRGLEKVLAIYRDHYGNLPTYITENGACYNDMPGDDGQIHDARRISYLQEHIRALTAALEGGCNVRGYFAWSLMDNFEWSHGYSKRFGLVHVGYENNNARLPKDSAHWYHNWISAFRQ